jgi:O-antigen/teichoic acid export membrane protein
MIQKRRVLVNALMAVVQVVVNGGAMLVLYRFLLDTIGAADFGVWALVLSWTTATSVASLGLSGGALKFVSQYLARADRDHVVRIVQTGLLTVAGVLGVVLVAVYPLLGEGLALVVEPESQIPDALAILPYALGSFWLMSMSAVVLSAIDGFQRVDLRSYVVTGGILVYVGLAFVFVKDRGLIGLAQAQVLQAALQLGAAWLVLHRLLPRLPWVPWRWHKGAFKEMLGYGLNLQVISVAKMFFEPTTKTLLSLFAGVSAVSFFEMAHKLIFQLRTIIVEAHRALVPTLADLQERKPELLREVYATSQRLLQFLILPSLPLIIALTPLISRLWIGRYEPQFVLFAVVIALGWFPNMFSNPAYFANMGTGHLRWNVYGHLAMGGLNAALGGLLGWQFGGTGVAVGFVIALLIGSFMVAAEYHHRLGIRTAAFVGSDSLRLALSGLVGMGAVLGLYTVLQDVWHPVLLTGLVLAVYLVIVAWPLWTHAMRPRVMSWALSLFRRTAPDASAEPSPTSEAA